MAKDKKKGLKRLLLWLVIGVFALGAVAAAFVIVEWVNVPAAPEPLPAPDAPGMEVRSESDREYTYMQVYYPRMQSEAANGAISAYVNEVVDRFRANSVPTRRPAKDELNLSFEMFRGGEEEDVVSFLFRWRSRYRNGAGEEGMRAMTFGLESGGQYDITSLLKGEDALWELSAQAFYALQDLDIYKDSEAERDRLQEGTAPYGENFSHFVVDVDQLRFYFEPGQVGTDANPTDRVELPLAALRKILSPPFVKIPEPPVPDVSALEGKKLIALTFDDGPSELTPKLLDFLKEEQVRATFFVLGTMVKSAPKTVIRAAAEGHQVGSHTYGHKDLTKISAESRKNQIESAAALLEETLGYRPTVMRPPYGASNKTVAAAADTPLIFWSIDPNDWKYRDAERVSKHVLDRAADGDIILLHDLYATSVEAAKAIVRTLKGQGFTFVTVDELLAARWPDITAGQSVWQRLGP